LPSPTFPDSRKPAPSNFKKRQYAHFSLGHPFLLMSSSKPGMAPEIQWQQIALRLVFAG